MFNFHFFFLNIEKWKMKICVQFSFLMKTNASLSCSHKRMSRRIIWNNSVVNEMFPTSESWWGSNIFTCAARKIVFGCSFCYRYENATTSQSLCLFLYILRVSGSRVCPVTFITLSMCFFDRAPFRYVARDHIQLWNTYSKAQLDTRITCLLW